jgi:hypothetical protein
MASMTTNLNQRYLLRPQYASSYNLTAGNAPTLNVGSTKFQVDGTVSHVGNMSYESVASGILSGEGMSSITSATAATVNLPQPDFAGAMKIIVVGSTTANPDATRVISASTMSCKINSTSVTLTSTQLGGVLLVADSTQNWLLMRDAIGSTVVAWALA